MLLAEISAVVDFAIDVVVVCVVIVLFTAGIRVVDTAENI